MSKLTGNPILRNLPKEDEMLTTEKEAFNCVWNFMTDRKMFSQTLSIPVDGAPKHYLGKDCNPFLKNQIYKDFIAADCLSTCIASFDKSDNRKINIFTKRDKDKVLVIFTVYSPNDINDRNMLVKKLSDKLREEN